MVLCSPPNTAEPLISLKQMPPLPSTATCPSSPASLQCRTPAFAPSLHCTFPFELVPGDRELVLDVEFVIPKHPLGGEGQICILQFHVLEIRLLLVRPAHRPGELVPVHLDRQCGRPLLLANLVLALPRPDWVCLLLRTRKAAEPEYQ